MKLALTSLMLLAYSAGAFAEGFWPNRPAVVRAATILAEEVEHFDEELHKISAPTHVIQKVHHFEDTVNEFAEAARTCSYQEASFEMQHIRQDMGMIRQEMNAHPHLLNYPGVYREWRMMRTAYRELDHAMFEWSRNKWSAADNAQHEADLKELEEHRANR